MGRRERERPKRPIRWPALLRGALPAGIVIGALSVVLIGAADRYTSSDRFCTSCHVHPQATTSWKQSTHYSTKSGVTVRCVECHLPPGGLRYAFEKARLGTRDVLGMIFKEAEKIDWEARSQLEYAATYTFGNACTGCHANLFPVGLEKKGDEAHLYYTRKADRLRCINCHLHVGHFDPDAGRAAGFGLPTSGQRQVYVRPAEVDRFEDFTEYIPGTGVSFEMVALPGGTFTIGSPEGEGYRERDEGPARVVRLSPFWMGRVEVTWDEFEAFYRQTAAEGRTDTWRRDRARRLDLDGITGATPPWGAPDQGWGRGERPAITMTHHAAVVYTQWLSQVTGKKYRLPTEAEWEYAARGGTTGAYFFGGEPGDYTKRRLWNRLFGTDREGIDPYVVYAGNSGGKTQPPSVVKPNPFGLLNMLGNVREFCLDWYAPDAYARYPEGEPVVDPRGPSEGTEHVIRGGSFRSDPADMRSAARDHTRREAWLLTDPQIPKSIWWYSDSVDVGFRVVLEYEGGAG